MPLAYVVATDLLARERLLGAARAAGFDAEPLRDLTAANPEPALVLLDLDESGALEAVRAWRPAHPDARILAFVSHVDRERWDAAVALGCEVHPRGASVRARDLIARG